MAMFTINGLIGFLKVGEFADNDSDERISRQSKNSDQTVSNCFPKFFCYRIYQTGEALGT